MSDSTDKKISRYPDLVFLAVLGLIIGLGIIILASVSAPFAQRKFGNTYYFLWHQILYGLLPGLFLALIVFKTNLSVLRKLAPALFLFNLFLMLLVFIPMVGSSQMGASRWLNLGPLSFQPAELLKLTFILYLASWLSSKSESRNFEKNQTFILFLVIIGAIGGLLVLQPNVSTFGVIVFAGLVMYFSSRTSLWHSATVILVGIAGLFILMQIAPYRLNRYMVFLNPSMDPMGIGYQAKHATIAAGSGGLTGVGLGMSVQKYGTLPEPIADSIFAVFSEETGFIGAFILIVLFLIFLVRGFHIAKNSQNSFAQLTAIGIVAWIIIQTFVNIGAMIGIVPLTGIPLPFVSYGGSALIIELLAMGILLNISKNLK